MSLNTYHVTLKNAKDIDSLSSRIQELGGQVVRYKFLPNILTVKIFDDKWDIISHDPRIKHHDEDHVYHTTELRQVNGQYDNRGLDRIDQRALPLDGLFHLGREAGSVNIYVFDTGIQRNIPDFGLRVSPLYDAFASSLDANFCADFDGHGTFIAGVLSSPKYGIATAAQLFTIKVLNPSGTTSGILGGINAAIEHYQSLPSYPSLAFRPACANLSFSGPKNSTLETAVLSLSSVGIIPVVSAGDNQLLAYEVTPAGAGTFYDPVTKFYTYNANKPIVTAASDLNDNFAPFSNYGGAVDIFAPGVNIASLGANSIQDVVLKSGTSVAAAFVTGVIALYLDSAPGQSVSQVRQWLLTNDTTNVINFRTNPAWKSGSPIVDNFQTPNKLLFQPFQSSNVIWLTPPGLLTTVNSEQNYSIQVQASSQTGAPLAYLIVDGIVPGTMDSNGIISGPAPLIYHSASYIFTVRAVNQSDVADQIFQINVIGKKVKPVWQTPAGSLGLVTEGKAVSIQLVGGELLNPTLTYTIISGQLPEALTLSPQGLISGLVEVVGNTFFYEFVVRLTDGLSPIDRTFTLTVAPISTLPYWVTPANLGNFSQGQPISLQLNAVDQDLDTISYAMPYGQGAAAEARLYQGVVDQVDVMAGGFGYVLPPTVIFATGTGGAAIANVSGGSVISITITDPGNNYPEPPTVIISGGGGTGAEAEAHVSNGQLQAITMTKIGFGYTSQPSVLISAGSGAQATSVISNGSVTSVDLI